MPGLWHFYLFKVTKFKNIIFTVLVHPDISQLELKSVTFYGKMLSIRYVLLKLTYMHKIMNCNNLSKHEDDNERERERMRERDETL